jgi:RNA polymerase sigma factor FliA
MSVQSHLFQVVDLLDIVHGDVAGVSRRLPAHVDRDDLRAAGYLALVQHFERAPLEEGEARAFLMRRVAGALRDELRRADTVGRRTRWLLKQAATVETEMQTASGIAPSLETVAKQLNVSAAKLESAKALAENASSAVRGELVEAIADAEPDPSQIAVTHDDYGQIREYLTNLTEKERIVVEMTILEDGTLEVAARCLKITKGRAHQLRKAALTKLRTALCQ